MCNRESEAVPGSKSRDIGSPWGKSMQRTTTADSIRGEELTSFIEWALRPENKQELVVSFLRSLTWSERTLERTIKKADRIISSESALLGEANTARLVRMNESAQKRLLQIRRQRDELIEYARRECVPLPPRAQLLRERRRSVKGLA